MPRTFREEMRAQTLLIGVLLHEGTPSSGLESEMLVQLRKQGVGPVLHVVLEITCRALKLEVFVGEVESDKEEDLVVEHSLVARDFHQLFLDKLGRSLHFRERRTCLDRKLMTGNCNFYAFLPIHRTKHTNSQVRVSRKGVASLEHPSPWNHALKSCQE